MAAEGCDGAEEDDDREAWDGMEGTGWCDGAIPVCASPQSRAGWALSDRIIKDDTVGWLTKAPGGNPPGHDRVVVPRCDGWLANAAAGGLDFGV
jgi:hypothetical protein